MTNPRLSRCDSSTPRRPHAVSTSRRARTARAGLLAAVVTAGPLFAGHARAGSQTPQLGVVDVGRYPDAVCNNGAAATFNYLLTTDRGPDGGVDYRKKWLVVLSGGGNCTDEATCAARWNEQPGGPNLDGGPGDHFNMVPDLTPRNFDGHGLLDFDGQRAPTGAIVGAHANPFAGPAADGSDGFNRVWINYCSSDSWQGLGTRVTVDPADFPQVSFDPGRPALTELHFGGAQIVDAVIATIMRGQLGGSDYVPDAVHGEVVLAGSSAGGNGTARNLDTVAGDIAGGVLGEFAAAPGVKVYGIVDAADLHGPIPTTSGAIGYASADFYTGGAPAAVRNDDDCVDDPVHRCYSVGDHVLANEISTPYFVVQQAYDKQIHAAIEAAVADAIRTQAAGWPPALLWFAASVFGSAEEAARAYIRFTITTSADSIGVARGNPAGLFIPNYDTGWHQLMADSERFYTSPVDLWPSVGDPRLGPAYAGTTVSIPTVLASFRQCVLGNYGAAGDYAGCVSTIRSVGVDQNVRVINSTAIP